MAPIATAESTRGPRTRNTTASIVGGNDVGMPATLAHTSAVS